MLAPTKPIHTTFKTIPNKPFSTQLSMKEYNLTQLCAPTSNLIVYGLNLHVHPSKPDLYYFFSCFNNTRAFLQPSSCRKTKTPALTSSCLRVPEGSIATFITFHLIGLYRFSQLTRKRSPPQLVRSPDLSAFVSGLSWRKVRVRWRF